MPTYDVTSLLKELVGATQLARLELTSPEAMHTLSLLGAAIHDQQIIQQAASRLGVAADVIVSALSNNLERVTQEKDAASSFTEFEIDTLEETGVDLSGPTNGFEPAEVLARAAAKSVSSGISVAEAAQRLSVTAGRVRQRIASQSLYAIRGIGGEWVVPVWQFDGGALLPGLEQVVPSISRQLHPRVVANFMTRPDPDLDGGEGSMSPAAWLATGGDAGVVAQLVAELPGSP